MVPKVKLYAFIELTYIHELYDVCPNKYNFYYDLYGIRVFATINFYRWNQETD